MEDKSKQDYLHNQGFSVRSNIGAHKALWYTKSSMGHSCSTFLKEEWYKIVVFREWASFN